MHHDQKVGLALGVLLIGAVAAFFFRNEAEPAAKIPTLQNPEDVNREIAEKRLTPYISEPETPPASLNESARTAPTNDSRTGELPLTSAATVGDEGDDPFQGADPNQVPAPAPDPIRVEDSLASAKPVEEPIEPPHDAQPLAESPPAGEPALQIHEVQRGETLSSIAGKYLGSQARYQDLFDANRDQLQNPNDLQVGMKLKIPPKKAGASANAPGVSAKPAGHQTVSAEPVSIETPVAATKVEEPASSAKTQNESAKSAAPDLKGRFTPSRRRPVSGNSP